MARQEIRDFYGRILGSVEEDSNGNKTVRSFHGVILGRYDKATDTTRDFHGRILSRGDTAVGLLYSQK